MPKEINNVGGAPSPANRAPAHELGPKTVLVFSPKGGPGKSTLSQNIAAAAAMAGHRVSLLDTDPQGSLSEWRALRPPTAPPIRAHLQLPLGSFHDKSPRDVMWWMGDSDLLVIDTPPAPENSPEGLAALFDAADLVLIPVRPRPADLHSTDALVPYIRERRRPFAFVLNLVRPRVREAAEARQLLGDVGEVAPVDLPDLVDVYRCFSAGLGVVEIGDSPAAAPFRELWRYVAGRLELRP